MGASPTERKRKQQAVWMIEGYTVGPKGSWSSTPTDHAPVCVYEARIARFFQVLKKSKLECERYAFLKY